jgi:hypothetical protein
MPACPRHSTLAISMRAFPKTIFGWQTTPLDALFEYLRRDFQGLFEKADLGPGPDCVVNGRFGTRHPHEFPENSRSAIESHYARARGRHDHLCRVTVSALRDPAPTLFIFGGHMPEDARLEAEREIMRYRGSAPFDLVIWNDRTMPPTVHGSWKGNHAFWSERLCGIEISDALTFRTRLVDCLQDQTNRAAKHLRRAKL